MFCLKVEFLFKTDSGYPKDTGDTLITLGTSGSPLRYNTHRSAQSVSHLAHSRKLRKRSQSPVDVLEHRDTYGQVQVCSKGRQGISVDRPCQPSFCQIKFWHVRNLLPQSIRLRLSVLVRYCAGQGEWSDFVVERALFHKYGVGRDISQPEGSVYPFDLTYLHRPHDSGPPLSLSE